MSWLDALLGRIQSGGTDLELEGALNFTGGLAATSNPNAGSIDVRLSPAPTAFKYGPTLVTVTPAAIVLGSNVVGTYDEPSGTLTISSVSPPRSSVHYLPTDPAELDDLLIYEYSGSEYRLYRFDGVGTEFEQVGWTLVASLAKYYAD